MNVLMVLLCLLVKGFTLGDYQFPFWWRPMPATCSPIPENFCPVGAVLYESCTTSKGPERGFCKTDTSCRGSTCRLVCEDGDPCGALPLTNYGFYILNDITDFTFGALAELNCIDGFTSLDGTITCQSDGSWSETNATCEPIDCGPPTQIPDGKYHPLNGTLFGNQATLSCNFLYIPVGGPDFIECLASGEWSASSVTCQPACPDGWIEFNNSCYFFSKVDARYSVARQFCLDNNSTLVQVDYVSENNFLKSTMSELASNATECEPDFGYWSDLFQATVNGQEVWRETNTPLDPNVADWLGNDPNDSGGQQSCTMFWENSRYRWADIECDAAGKPDRESNRLGRALCELHLPA